MDEKKSTTGTDQITNSHQKNSQSETRHVPKLQTSDILLLPVQNPIGNSIHTNYPYKFKEMDIKTVESIEREDPSEETLKLTRRWKKIVKPGDYDLPRDNGNGTTLRER